MGIFNARMSDNTPTWLIGFGEPVHNFTVQLTAGTDTELPVPEFVDLAVFSAGENVLMAKNAVITDPNSGTFTNAPGFLLKPGAPVTPGDVLHFWSPNASLVTVTFYSGAL